MIIATMMTAPPINTLKGGISFKNNQTQIGPKSVSVSINKPIVAEAVDLEPIVMQINPRANWGTPNKNPIKISWLEKLKDSDKKNPYMQLKIPE